MPLPDLYNAEQLLRYVFIGKLTRIVFFMIRPMLHGIQPQFSMGFHSSASMNHTIYPGLRPNCIRL